MKLKVLLLKYFVALDSINYCNPCFFLQNGTKLRVADFVHGADGLGNQSFPPPKGKPIEESAAAFFGSSSKS